LPTNIIGALIGDHGGLLSPPTEAMIKELGLR